LGISDFVATAIGRHFFAQSWVYSCPMALMPSRLTAYQVKT
jgi:hypothetical protein